MQVAEIRPQSGKFYQHLDCAGAAFWRRCFGCCRDIGALGRRPHYVRLDTQATSHLMADTKVARDYPDCDRINRNEDYEVAYWTNHIGVSKEVLLTAIDGVGPMVKNIAAELVKKARHCARPRRRGFINLGGFLRRVSVYQRSVTAPSGTAKPQPVAFRARRLPRSGVTAPVRSLFSFPTTSAR